MSDPVSRVRFRFRRGPEAVFISHLDFVRTLERAVRRAELPIAFTQGFHPHPRISFASALPVGVLSEAEYVDMEFSAPVLARDASETLSRALPLGLSVTAARGVPLSAGALAAAICAASYEMVFAREDIPDPKGLAEAVRELSGGREIFVQKESKGKVKEIDLGAMVYEAAVLDSPEGQVAIAFTGKSGSEGNVRPEDIISYLEGGNVLARGALPVKVTRTGLYACREGRLVTPMEYLR